MTGVYIDSCYGAVNCVSRTAYNDYSYAYRKYADNGYSSANNQWSGSYYNYSYPNPRDNGYSTSSYSSGYSGGYDYSNYGSYYQYNYPNPMSNDGSVWQNYDYYNAPNGNYSFDYYNDYYKKYYQNNNNTGNQSGNTDGTGTSSDQTGNGTDYAIVLSGADEAKIKEQLGVIVDEEALRLRQEEAGSFGGALATGAGAAVIGIPGIQKGLFGQVRDIPKVREVGKIFWETAGKTEKGLALWSKYPEQMMQFEAKMNELNVQFSRIAAKNPNSPVVAEKLNELNRIAENAIRSGKPERIAQADIQITEALNASKGEGFLSKLFNRGHIENATIKSSAARAAEESAAKTAAERTVVKAGAERSAIRGTLCRSMFRGAGAMAVLSAGIDVIEKKSRGEEINWAETGTRAVLSSVAFCAAERVAAWGVGKIVGRVAGACAGKAIGAAVGSVIPGIGTAIGFVVGCIADWAINKYVMPKLFPPDTTDAKNQIKKMDKSELLATCLAMNQDIGKTAQKFIDDNKEASKLILEAMQSAN